MKKTDKRYRRDLPKLPANMRSLPVSDKGYPIPFFVAVDADGIPDFRIAGRGKFQAAVDGSLCWICGKPLHQTGHRSTVAGYYYVAGTMAAINNIAAEPAMHRECAEFSVKVCPFLARPNAKRREAGRDETAITHASAQLYNPGVSLVWQTRTFDIIRGDRGDLVKMGEPIRVQPWCKGRPAKPTEVAAAFEISFKKMMEIASDEDDQALIDVVKQAAAGRLLLGLIG